MFGRMLFAMLKGLLDWQHPLAAADTKFDRMTKVSFGDKAAPMKSVVLASL